MEKSTRDNAIMTSVMSVFAIVFIALAFNSAWWHWFSAAVAIVIGWVYYTDSTYGQSVRSWLIERLTEGRR